MKFIDTILQNKFYKKYREIVMMLIDLIIVAFSYAIAVWTKGDFSLDYFLNTDNTSLFWMMGTILWVYFISFLLFKINRSLWKYISIKESFAIASANFLAAIILFLMVLWFYPYRITEYFSIVLIATLLIILCMFGVRVTYRLVRKNVMHHPSAKRTLIIGAGNAGSLLAKEFVQNPDLGFWPIGFIDDYKKGKVVSGFAIYGDLEDLPKVIEKNRIEVIVIAMPSTDKKRIREIYEECQKIKLPIKIMNDINHSLGDDLHRKVSVQDINLEDLLSRGAIKLEQHEIESYITGKVVCVTGAAGSIGAELCRQIIRFKPKKLLLLDINENGLYMLEQEFNRNRMHNKLDDSIEIISYIASIREKYAIDDIFDIEQPDVVYHAAAHKHVPLMETRPMEAIKNNVFGTNNVIHSCMEHKVERCIMISTDKAVNPTNVMGATKRMTEMILQSLGQNGITKMAAVRFGNVLGSNGSVIPIFKKQIEEGGPLTLTSREITRYFMTIPEATQLVLQAGFYADQGEIFVLDMGEPVKIIDLAEKMIRLAGFEPYEDIDIKEIGLRQGEKMYEELSLHGETTTKTKNDLILKNEVMHISTEEIKEKLTILSDALTTCHDGKELKKTILDVIIND